MTTDRRSLAQQAGMLCNLPAFGRYLDARARRDKGLTVEQLPDGTHNAEDAADAVRRACGVESRADLDRNAQAAEMYTKIVADFGRWKRRSES